MNTENTVDIKESLTQKLEILKKNLNAVSLDVLKTRYAKAYQKLMENIVDLSNQYIVETILYLDLSCVTEESLPKFAHILSKNKEIIQNFLLNAESEEYFKFIDEIAKEYTNLWCDNVMKVSGESYIFNPITLKKIEKI